MPDTTLPIHPRTGLRAVGIVGGRPVWPILGGSSLEPPPPGGATPPAPAFTPPSPAPAPGHSPAPAGDDPMNTDAGRRALAAERQRAADEKKRADDLEAQLRSIQDQGKTEAQLNAERLQDLEKRYAESEVARLRLQVATTHNLPAGDLIFLTGSTEADLTAQATAVAAKNAASSTPAPPPPAFAPNPGQAAGNGGSPAPAATVAAGRDLYKQKNTKT